MHRPTYVYIPTGMPVEDSEFGTSIQLNAHRQVENTPLEGSATPQHNAVRAHSV